MIEIISQLKKNQFSKPVEIASEVCKAWEFLGSFSYFRLHLDFSLNDSPHPPSAYKLGISIFKGAHGEGKLHNSCREMKLLQLIQVGLFRQCLVIIPSKRHISP